MPGDIWKRAFKQRSPIPQEVKATNSPWCRLLEATVLIFALE